MSLSRMLQLTLRTHKSLYDNLPGLIEEVNTLTADLGLIAAPGVKIVPAKMSVNREVLLGLQTEMLKRPIAQLPAIAVGIFARQNIEDGDQQFSQFLYPFTIDVYLGGKEVNDLYIVALKWALILDQWVELYSNDVMKGVTGEEAPDIDISYALDQNNAGFRQLVTATGVFTCWE